VIPKNPKATKARCECGAHLAWEERGTYSGKHRLGICANPECGLIATNSTDHPEGELQRFLVGHVPTARYLRPWARFFFKATVWGYRWRPHAEGCRECGSEMVAALDLDWRPDRLGDPIHVALCVHCGATETAFWTGRERVSLWLTGATWDDPPPPIQALKHALEDRAASRHDDFTWDFGFG